MASGSQSGSEAETASQAGSKSVSKEGEGSGSGGESEGGDESEGGNSQHGNSGSEVVESCSEAEESESESGSSKLEAAIKKAWPDRKTSESDPNASKPISLPQLNSKDSKEEWKTNCHGFAHCMDTDFSAWRDKKINKGLKQWYEWDKMICDHADPCKEAKYPDPLGAPLDYMESHDVFKPIKTSEYDLCHFYQVGLTGDFPKFPEPHEPMTSNHVCSTFIRRGHHSLSTKRTPCPHQPSMPKDGDQC